MDIQGEHVGFSYNAGTPLEVEALRGLDFHVPSGASIGIVGGNGSGKTTLVRLLNGLLVPTRGRVTIGGKDTRSWGPELKRSVGLLFQRPERQLFETTVARDIAFALGSPDPGNDRSVRASVEQAATLAGVDLDSVGGRNPQELSDGEKRRVALAGILVNEPEILVLDEPAVGLNAPDVAHLVEVLSRWKRSGGKTVVVVSHDLDPFAEFLDLLMVLEEGACRGFGTVRDVCRRFRDDPSASPFLPAVPLLLERLAAEGRPLDVRGCGVAEVSGALAGLLMSAGET